jgi:hypothetical protein
MILMINVGKTDDKWLFATENRVEILHPGTFLPTSWRVFPADQTHS